MIFRSLIRLFVIALVFFSSSCAYRNNVMFSHEKDFKSAQLEEEARSLESNYTIKPNDLLNIKVYTKKGEMIIDPENELNKDINMNKVQRPDPEYLVGLNGIVFLPMVGEVNLEGLSIHEANLKLINLYSEFFVDPYVITTYTNKRVTVLGAPGGQILALQNENITVAEVIAMAGGMGKTGNASKISLIRGNEFFLIDFSTVDGYSKTNQLVKAGDIIYIEPINRVIAENANTFALILSAITTTTALLVLFIK